MTQFTITYYAGGKGYEEHLQAETIAAAEEIATERLQHPHFRIVAPAVTSIVFSAHITALVIKPAIPLQAGGMVPINPAALLAPVKRRTT